MEESDSFRTEQYRLEKIAAEVESRVQERVFEYQANIKKRTDRSLRFVWIMYAIMSVIIVWSAYSVVAVEHKLERAVQRIEKLENMQGKAR